MSSSCVPTLSESYHSSVRLTLCATSTTSFRFDRIIDLPEPLLPTFNRVASFADTHVSFSEARSRGNDIPAGVHLVWSDLRDSISSRPGTDIAFDLVQSTTIHNDDGSVTHLAADVTEFLADLFPAVAREKLMDRVGAVFAGGPSKAGDGTVTVMQSRDEEEGWERSGWEYRLLCAHPNMDLPGHFIPGAMGLTRGWSRRYIHEVKRKHGFFSLGGSVRHSYKADVVAMRLAVEEGFGLHL